MKLDDLLSPAGRRLGRYFGTMPEFWINLQVQHDLHVTEWKLRAKIERVIEPHATNAGPVSAARWNCMTRIRKPKSLDKPEVTSRVVPSDSRRAHALLDFL